MFLRIALGSVASVVVLGAQALGHAAAADPDGAAANARAVLGLIVAGCLIALVLQVRRR